MFPNTVASMFRAMSCCHCNASNLALRRWACRASFATKLLHERQTCVRVMWAYQNALIDMYTDLIAERYCNLACAVVPGPLRWEIAILDLQSWSQELGTNHHPQMPRNSASGLQT